MMVTICMEHILKIQSIINILGLSRNLFIIYKFFGNSKVFKIIFGINIILRINKESNCY